MPPWFSALPFFHVLNFKKKEAFHFARFEKDSRYYILRLERDLLEDWTITAINGRIKSKLGQSRTLAFPTFDEAFTSFCDMAKIRFQRNYYLKLIACEAPLSLCFLPFLLKAEMPGNKTCAKAKTETKTRLTNRIFSADSEKTDCQQMGFSF